MLCILAALTLVLETAAALPLRQVAQPCGNDVRGFLPCPDGQYCARVSAFHYLCRPQLEGTRGAPLYGLDYAPHERNGHGFGGGTQSAFCTPTSCLMLCLQVPECIGFVFFSYDLTKDPFCGPFRCKIFDKMLDTPKKRANAVTWLVDRDAPCPTPSRGVCGGFLRVTACCPRGEQCMLTGRVRRCLPPSPQCTVPLFGRPLHIKTDFLTLGVEQDECCELCATTPGCARYQFTSVNGECAIYVEAGPPRYSEWDMFADPIKPLPPCETEKGGACGDTTSGAGCCPPDSYCQPLSASKFNCIERPPKCAKQVPQTELKGEDLFVKTVESAGECCGLCETTEKCKAYTYIHDHPRGPLCKLKADKLAAAVYHSTAVSGYLNSMYA
ncbi:hypothetical protein PINS_up007758 [Pythium insidiosum]|nr:hypothetical protein PINS_up007758 [Pythium insidiosum]